MRILLDTHILLWTMTNDHRLSARARGLLEQEELDLYFSPISISEISVKHRLHPDEMKFDGTETRHSFLEAGFSELPYTSSQAATMDLLPMHHRDPFDRMLIAQAKASGMKIMSHDDRFPAYGDCVLSV